VKEEEISKDIVKEEEMTKCEVDYEYIIEHRIQYGRYS